MKKNVASEALRKRLAEKAEAQPLNTGGSSVQKTDDPNFPVFKIEPNTREILYFLRGVNGDWCTAAEDSEGGDILIHNPLRVNVHKINAHKQAGISGEFRCVHALEDEEMGYDGHCPFCEAANDAWKLYNEKLSIEADRRNLDAKGEEMKDTRSALSRERAVDSVSPYVVCAVARIPVKGSSYEMLPADDLKDPETGVKIEYMVWGEDRFTKHFDEIANAAGMESIIGVPVTAAYPVDDSIKDKGKRAMFAAKDARFNPVSNKATLGKFNEKFINFLENRGKEFTRDKALEVLTAAQFLEMEQIESIANKAIRKTRMELDSIEMSGGDVSAAALLGVKDDKSGVGKALSDFGSDSKDLGVADEDDSESFEE